VGISAGGGGGCWVGGGVFLRDFLNCAVYVVETAWGCGSGGSV